MRQGIFMRKSIFVLCVLLLTLQVAHATEIFSGEKQENEFFTIAGEKVQFDYYPSLARISFNAFGVWSQIDKGSCRTFEKFEVCFKEIGDTVQTADRGAQYMIELKINDLSPRVEVELETSDKTVDISEEFEITATIINSGNSPAYGVSFEQVFPSSVQVLSSTAQKSGNVVTWKGDLKANEHFDIVSKCTLKDLSAFTLTGKVISFVDGKPLSVEAEPIAIKASLPFDFSIGFADKTVRADDLIEMSIHVDNANADVLDITSLRITLPKGVTPVSLPAEFKNVNGTVSFSKKYTKGNDADYVLKFQPKYDGEYIFNATLNAKADAAKIQLSQEDKIIVNSKDVIGVIQLPDKVFERDSYKMVVTLENIADKEVTVTYEIKSDLFVNIFKRSISLQPGENKTVVDNTFRALDVEQDTPHQVALTLSTGTIEQKFTKSLLVRKRDELISFRETVDVDADEAHVVVYAKNLVSRELKDVDFIDEVPSIIKTTGDRFSTMVLPAGETKVLDYFVQLRPNQVGPAELTHTVNVKTVDGLYVLEKQFLVSFEKEGRLIIPSNSTANTTAHDSSDSTNVQQPEETERDETSAESGVVSKGFFSRLFSGIGHFFSTIFS